MTLTLDVGNSNITGGVFDGDTLILQFRQTTHKNSSSDEIGIFLPNSIFLKNLERHVAKAEEIIYGEK